MIDAQAARQKGLEILIRLFPDFLVIHVVVQCVLVAIVGPAVVLILPPVGIGVEVCAFQDRIDVGLIAKSEGEQLLIERVVFDGLQVGVNYEFLTAQREPLVAAGRGLGQLLLGAGVVLNQFVHCGVAGAIL